MKLQKIKYFFRLYKAGRAGTTAVEFALIAIPFLVVLFGIMESGRMLWMMNGVQFAAEETARYASLNPGTPAELLNDYAEEKLAGMRINANGFQLTSSTVMSNGLEFVEVQAGYSHVTMLNGFLPGDYGIIDYSTQVRKPVIF